MPTKNNLLLTHFRFKRRKDAAYWGRTTKDWIPIQEIKYTRHGAQLASFSFAWITIDKNIEFSVQPYILCAKCESEIVTRTGEKCEECEFQDEDLDNDVEEE